MNFGLDISAITVNVASNVCQNVTLQIEHTTITCYVGPGVGKDLLVEVDVAGLDVSGGIFGYDGKLKKF